MPHTWYFDSSTKPRQPCGTECCSVFLYDS